MRIPFIGKKATPSHPDIEAARAAFKSGNRGEIKEKFQKLFYRIDDAFRPEQLEVRRLIADHLLAQSDATPEELRLIKMISGYEDRAAERTLAIDDVPYEHLESILKYEGTSFHLRQRALRRIMEKPNEVWVWSFLGMLRPQDRSGLDGIRADEADVGVLHQEMMEFLMTADFDSEHLFELYRRLRDEGVESQAKPVIKEKLLQREVRMYIRYDEYERGFFPFFRDKEGNEFDMNWQLLESSMGELLKGVAVLSGEELLTSFDTRKIDFYAKS